GYPVYHSSYYRVPRLREGAKLMVADYDCVPERFPESCPGLDYIRELKTHAFKHADLIVSISESSRQDVMRFYQVPGEKIKVLHLGINEFFDVPAQPLPPHSGRPYLLYVGSRAVYKNFDLLLSAFEQGLFPGFDLRVVGGEAPLKSDKIPGGQSSLYWERADDIRLRELYWNAQALVYPSTYEGFGLPPLEALASGCPVVAGETPAVREVLATHAEFFPCDEIEGLVAAVERAVGWPEQRRQEAYLHARSFSWSRAAERLGEYYRGLTS
ncbi:MAG: glycosyltransferase family 1 protein, partial [Mariprofundaceae bacterium]|nr:glycosyltransferase family 1 protein [Mariprofundaceae bacterium]